MLLSIIIPYHNETKEDVAPLFKSIDAQAGIDFNNLEIIMVRDIETAPLDNEPFEEYPNIKDKIKKLYSPYKCNPGMSRQMGIDHAQGEYVIFCDADDCLYHVCALREIQENIEATHADVYRARFIEEMGTETDPKRYYQIKDFNWVWVFAKVYRRAFLQDHGLRFSEKLRWHEDNYLNTLCSYCDPKVVDLQTTPMYLWRYNAGSITRVNNHEYSFSSIDELLDARDLAYEIILKDYRKNCTRDILYVIVREYLVLVDPANADNPKYETIAKRFYDFVAKFTPALITEEYSPELNNFIFEVYKTSDSKFIPRVSLKDYMTELDDKFNKNKKE